MKFTPYSLRRDYAVRGSVAYGVPVAIMAQMMGHAPDVLLRTYNCWITADTAHQIYLQAISRA